MRSNRPLLEGIARQVAPLLGELVFVGGATTELFFTSRVAPGVRLTRDADVICEVTGRLEYHRLGGRLRALGFSEDTSPGAPLCRWRSAAGLLDVMPSDEAILGFSNRWYAYGIRTARWLPLTPDLSIRVVTPPVFLATKLAAYAGRGGGDLIGSHDIEDIVNVVAFREEIVAETAAESTVLRDWLGDELRMHLIGHRDADDALVANLPDARLVPELVTNTKARFAALARLAWR